MANPENLKGHGFNEIAASRQREIAKAGALASHEARREKKLFKEAILKKLNAESLEAIVMKQIQKAAIDGDVKSVEFLRDTIGEKPTITTESDITTGGESIKGIEVVIKDFKK